MKRNLKKFAAALLFASVAISCSLTMWASPLVHGSRLAVSKAPVKGTTLSSTGGDPSNPLGGIMLVPPFDANYSLFSLGSVPGVPTYYGGLTFKYNDPNTLLIRGAAGSPAGLHYSGWSHPRRERAYHRLFRQRYTVSGRTIDDRPIQRRRPRLWTGQCALCNSLSC